MQWQRPDECSFGRSVHSTSGMQGSISAVSLPVTGQRKRADVVLQASGQSMPYSPTTTSLVMKDSAMVRFLICNPEIAHAPTPTALVLCAGGEDCKRGC